MKLTHINRIAHICEEFQNKIISYGEHMPDDKLMAHIQNSCAEITEHEDDTIDIDYDDMCFTVHKNNNGDWELCENASYYIYKNGFLDTVDGVIDVELN